MKENYESQFVLIDGLKQGYEKAYEYLVEHFHYRLCVYDYSLIMDDLMAEDIVQSVFISCMGKTTQTKT